MQKRISKASILVFMEKKWFLRSVSHIQMDNFSGLLSCSSFSHNSWKHSLEKENVCNFKLSSYLCFIWVSYSDTKVTGPFTISGNVQLKPNIFPSEYSISVPILIYSHFWDRPSLLRFHHYPCHLSSLKDSKNFWLV